MPGKISITLSSPKSFVSTIIERKVLVGFQGAPGQPGSPGGKEVYNAGTALSSGRVVSVLNNTANYFNPSGNYEPIGITQNAALSGDQVTVILSGPITMSGWGLTPGARYFALANGTITSDASQCVGRVQQIGVAEDSDTLIIHIQPAIKI